MLKKILTHEKADWYDRTEKWDDGMGNKVKVDVAKPLDVENTKPLEFENTKPLEVRNTKPLTAPKLEKAINVGNEQDKLYLPGQ